MSRLRFLLGGSGAGKSTRLYEEIIRHSEEEPDKNFLILVPDQFTLETQRAIVRMHPKKGILNIDALSFSRLTHRVFDETSYPSEAVLDDLGKSLVLRHVAETMRGDLPVIGAGMRKKGFVDEVKSAVSELMQYDISPEQMSLLIDGCETRPHLKSKLTDLQKLYQGFTDYIRETYLTPEETLAVCARRIASAPLMQGAVIAIDGFTGFTPIQYRVLRAMYTAASEMIVTVTITPEALLQKEEGADLFSLSKKTIRDLTMQMHRAERDASPGFVPELAIWEEARKKDGFDAVLDGKDIPHPEESGAIRHLERHLFRASAIPFEKETKAVRLMTASTAGEEVRQTFRTIRKLLRADETLAMRDITIILAQPELYADLVAEEAEHFDIPVYRDFTVSIRLNPLIEYLRSIMDILRGDFSAPAVFHYLRSGMTPFAMPDVDITELYVEACGIRGRRMWSERFIRNLYDRVKRTDEESIALSAVIERVRAGMMERFAPLLAVIDGKGTVRDMTAALYAMTETDGVQARLSEYAERFAAEGDPASAAEYRQIMKKVVRLFDTVVALLGDESVRIAEYADILEAGFSEITLGTIPMDIDRVTVGDLTRTRISGARYLFLLGASDAAIPAHEAGGGLLTEIDRTFLRDAVPEIEFAPSPAELMYRQRLYLYMMLTKPADALTVSYARMTAADKGARPSYLIDHLTQLFPKVVTESPETDPVAEQVETADDMRRRMTLLARRYADGYMGAEEEKTFFTLFGALSGTERDALSHAAFYSYHPEPLPGALSAGLYGSETFGTVSRLESYASCAYAHFLTYGLRLKEKTTHDFNRMDLGNVYHGVLELFQTGLEREGLSWTSFTKEDAKRMIAEALRAYTTENGAKLYENARARQTLVRIARILERTVMTLRYQLEKGGFTPAFAERDFNRVIRGGDKEIRLYGRIDRIDLAREGDATFVKIIDFKSGRRDFDISSMYYGLQLQLVLYMDEALRSEREGLGKGDVIPAAMLYYRVTDPYVDKDLKDNTEGQRMRALRMTGLVNSDGRAIDLLDKDLTGTSDVIPVRRDSRGEIASTSGVFATGEYELIAAHAERMIAEMGEGIMNGNIAIRPYELEDRNACTWCAYHSICGFDVRIDGFERRRLKPLQTQEALMQMRQLQDDQT